MCAETDGDLFSEALPLLGINIPVLFLLFKIYFYYFITYIYIITHTHTYTCMRGCMLSRFSLSEAYPCCHLQ